jgi:hypothetical protein
VLLSRNAGESYSVAYEAQDVRDVAYARDGADVWVADYDGVSVSSDGLVSFERHGIAAWASCVVEHDDRLWICGQYEGENATASGVGVSGDGANTVSKWFDFREIVTPVGCDAQSVTGLACEAAWAHWQVEVLGLEQPVLDAGSDARTGGTSGFDAGRVPSSSGGAGGAPIGITPTGGASGSVNGSPPDDDGWCTLGVAPRTGAWQSLALIVAVYLFRRSVRPRSTETFR